MKVKGQNTQDLIWLIGVFWSVAIVGAGLIIAVWH